MLNGGQYCFADMKGAICLADTAAGTIREIGRMTDAVSADLARFELNGSSWAVVADHRGALAMVDAAGARVDLPGIGVKVRARPRIVLAGDGRPLIVVLDARSTLQMIDPARRQPSDGALSACYWPRTSGHAAVAAPLLFRHDGAGKLFLADRSAAVSQIDLASGRIEWSELLPYGVDSDPVHDAESGLILFTSGESLHGSVRGMLHAYAPAERALRWQAQLEGGADVTPLLTRWRGRRVVVTATLRDAAIYVFDLADGQPVARVAVPETAACRHLPQGCVPVGYAAYHTQTALCKFYAAPLALVTADGAAVALYAASQNGRLYCLSDAAGLTEEGLGGPVRASAASAGPGTRLVHAGARLCRLTAPAGGRLETAAPGHEDPYRLLHDDPPRGTVRPQAAGVAGRYLKRKLRKRVLGADIE